MKSTGWNQGVAASSKLMLYGSYKKKLSKQVQKLKLSEKIILVEEFTAVNF